MTMILSMLKQRVFIQGMVMCWVLTTAAIAQANFPQESPTLNRKVRNLGMGNTGIALKGSHGSSPFYNPAGLNDLKDGRFEFLGFTAEMSKSAFDLIGDIRELTDDLDAANTDADELRVFNNFLADNTGKYRHLRLTFDLVNYARRNFAAGFLLDQRLDLNIRNDVPESFVVRNLGDVALYFAGAYGFWDELLQVGVTFKPTVRFSLDEADEVMSFLDVQNKNASGDPVLVDQFKKIYQDRRFSLGVDLGLKSNLSFGDLDENSLYKLLQPQVGFTWENMGSPSFGAGPDNRQTFNVGMAVHPTLWKLRNAIALDVRQINEERPLLSKLHFGVESQLPWIVTARAGVSQGYLTAGASFDLWIAQLEGAIYFEEEGVATRRGGNMRWAVRLAFQI